MKTYHDFDEDAPTPQICELDLSELTSINNAISERPDLVVISVRKKIAAIVNRMSQMHRWAGTSANGVVCILQDKPIEHHSIRVADQRGVRHGKK